MRVLRVLAVLVPVLIASHASAQRQWKMIAKLPLGASTVFFLDKVGAPQVGFVGAGVSILRTSDGGKTWVTILDNCGNIRDFAFEDSLIGIAACGSSANAWRTTDAGLTWTFVVTYNASSSVAYSDYSKLYFLNTIAVLQKPILQTRSIVSSDHGLTWQLTSLPPRMNGFAFCDRAQGIIASHDPTDVFYHTSNGGSTWQPTTFYDHVFSPISLDWLQCSFAALSETSHNFYLSDDAGQTWKFVSKFPGLPTGTLRAHNGYLWAQSLSGVYISTDIGQTWNNLCGPGMGIDGRFYTIDSTIVASDRFAALWELEDGRYGPGSPTLIFNASTTIGTQLCASLDSAIPILSPGCYDIFDSIWLTGSPNIQIISKPFGVIQPENAVAVRYTPDSIHGYDTAVLHIRWGFPGGVHDTTLMVYGQVIGGASTVTIPEMAATLDEACHALDTQLSIHSIACKTLTILKIYLEDSSVFHLRTPPLPSNLASNAALNFSLSANTQDTGTIQTRIHVITSSVRGIVDSSFLISLRTVDFAHPWANILRVLSKDLCDPVDTVLWIHNPYCKAIAIEHIRNIDTDIVLSDTNFPIAIGSNDSVAVRFHIKPSVRSSVDSAVFAFRSGDLQFDTAFYVTARTIRNTWQLPNFSSPQVRFGLTSTCSQKTQILSLLSPKCGDIKITSIAWAIADSQFSIDSVPLPLFLHSGGWDTLHFHFKPTSAKNSTAILKLRFEFGAEQKDTTIFVNGTGIDTGTATLSAESIQYPPISRCDVVVDSVTYQNISCDTMLISSIYDWQSNGYTVLSPKLPTSVPSGDSVAVVVKFNPSSIGRFDDSLDIQYTGNKTPTVSRNLRLRLIANVTASPNGPELRSVFSAGNFSVCSGDTTLYDTLRNTGCDTLFLDHASIAGDAAFTLGSDVPKYLAKDSSFLLPIHFSPRTKGVHSAAVIVQWDSAGNTKAAAHAISGEGLPGSKWLAARDGTDTRDFGELHVCESRDTLVWFVNPGCDTLVVESARVESGELSYTLGSLSYPLVLGPDSAIAIPVHCLPDTSGVPSSVSGTLRVFASNSDSAKEIDIPLAAKIVYPEKMQLAFGRDVLRTSSSGAVVNSNSGEAGDRLTYTLLLTRGKDVRSTSLQSISFSLTNDDDLLALEDATGLHLDSIGAAGAPHTTRRYYTLSPIPQSDTISMLSFTVYLAEAKSTPIQLGDVRFANTLGIPDNCIATITTSDADFTYVDGCADLETRDFMVTGAVRIDRIVPNPASSTIRVEGRGLRVEGVEVYDVMGRRIGVAVSLVAHQTTTPQPPPLSEEGELSLDVRGLAEGMYYIRIGGAAASFEILR